MKRTLASANIPTVPGAAICRVWPEEVPGIAGGRAICRVWPEEVPGIAGGRVDVPLNHPALWLIAETWLAFGELDDYRTDAEDGTRLLRVVLRPYLTPDGGITGQNTIRVGRFRREHGSRLSVFAVAAAVGLLTAAAPPRRVLEMLPVLSAAAR